MTLSRTLRRFSGDVNYRRWVTSTALRHLNKTLDFMVMYGAGPATTYPTRSALHDLLERAEPFGTHDLRRNP